MIANPFLTALKEVAQHIGKKLDVGFEKLLNKKDESISPAIQRQTVLLTAAVSRIEMAVKKIQDPVFSGEVTIDTTDLQRSVSDMKKAVEDIEMPNLQRIEVALAGIYSCIEKYGASNQALFAEVAAAIKGISFSVPETFKLDQTQLRSIRAANAGGLVTRGENLAARNVRTTNTAVTVVATEYSYTFPSNTVSWTLKLRDQGTLWYYAFVTGKLPNSGDGSNYVTVPQNFLQSKENVDWSGKTIYFGAELADMTMEITVYTL